jgi:hypothetical protein
MADQTERSPECSRTTSSPFAYAALISSMIASSESGAVSMIRAPFGH